MGEWLQTIITIAGTMIASSGFWAYMLKKMEKKDVKTDVLIGLAHDRITWLGMAYINRGYITQDEYENLSTYLFEPYEKIGGNGSAKRIMEEVDKLPFR